MKIVIIGGTGLIGSKLARKLRQQGHDVVPAAPSTGVNTITGEGVDKALSGAEIVVDSAAADFTAGKSTRSPIFMLRS